MASRKVTLHVQIVSCALAGELGPEASGAPSSVAAPRASQLCVMPTELCCGMQVVCWEEWVSTETSLYAKKRANGSCLLLVVFCCKQCHVLRVCSECVDCSLVWSATYHDSSGCGHRPTPGQGELARARLLQSLPALILTGLALPASYRTDSVYNRLISTRRLVGGLSGVCCSCCH